MIVYSLSYMRPLPDSGHWAGMFVGVYSSIRQVEAAKERLRRRPGFCDYPEGFRVECSRVDEDYDDPMFFTAWPRTS
jgi:hypothetical protein